MGFRTVVILHNDRADEWTNDPKLGENIFHGANAIGSGRPGPNAWDNPANMRYGQVVECTHADTITLAVIECLRFHPLTYSNWHRDEDETQRNLALLRDMADKLGYRLVKKSK